MQPFTGNGDVQYEWKILKRDEKTNYLITVANLWKYSSRLIYRVENAYLAVAKNCRLTVLIQI